MIQRIHGHQSEPARHRHHEKATIQSLYELPKELPPPSHTKITSKDLGSLILPEGTDLSRVSAKHPIATLFGKLWLNIFSRLMS